MILWQRSLALAPDTLPNLNVIGSEWIGPITALVHDGPRTSPCWVNSSGQGVPYDYEVNYEAPNPRQTAPVIRGKAGQWVKKNTTTPLRKARISLFRAGDSSLLTSTESDKDGRFLLRPEPGIYELLMTRKGFHNVRVPAFLVPRENVTVVDLSTSDENTVVISQ